MVQTIHYQRGACIDARSIPLVILRPTTHTWCRIPWPLPYGAPPERIEVVIATDQIPTKSEEPRLNWEEHVSQPGGRRRQSLYLERIAGSVFREIPATITGSNVK